MKHVSGVVSVRGGVGSLLSPAFHSRFARSGVGDMTLPVLQFPTYVWHL